MKILLEIDIEAKSDVVDMEQYDKDLQDHIDDDNYDPEFKVLVPKTKVSEVALKNFKERLKRFLEDVDEDDSFLDWVASELEIDLDDYPFSQWFNMTIKVDGEKV